MALGETNIFLIPKCDNLVSMKDLHLISLCDVVCKIVSMVHARILSKCISKEKDGFVAK